MGMALSVPVQTLNRFLLVSCNFLELTNHLPSKRSIEAIYSIDLRLDWVLSKFQVLALRFDLQLLWDMAKG